MMSLDDEISHLQKENNQSDSQLHRLKSDVTGLETDNTSDDKVSQDQVVTMSEFFLIDNLSTPSPSQCIKTVRKVVLRLC